MKKPSLLENKQLEKEKEDFQEVLFFLKNYKPVKYKPNKELLKKRNNILSSQKKNSLSLLNHFKWYSFNFRRSKTLSADIIWKYLGRESVKYNLKVETKINDLVMKYIADLNSVLSIKEGPSGIGKTS